MEAIEKLDDIRYDRELVEGLLEKHSLRSESDDKNEEVDNLTNTFRTSSLDFIESKCESDIEKQFAYALYWVGTVHGLWVQVMTPSLYGNLFLSELEDIDDVGKGLAVHFSKTDLIIVPNLPINCKKKKYRADFMLSFTPKGKKKRKFLLVECDSFMYHSSQKHLTKDKQRERDLRAEGWEIVRFSGGELYKNPSKVAYEMYSNFLGYGEK